MNFQFLGKGLAVLLCLFLFSCKQNTKTEDLNTEKATEKLAEQVVEQVYFVGTMSDNGCQIEIALQNDGFFNCAGYVLYPESEPTLVVGNWEDYLGDDGDIASYHNITLTEYQSDGTVSGRFLIHLTQAEGSDILRFEDAERTYIHIDQNDQTAAIVDVTTCSKEMPEWFPESPFIPASYNDIGTDYAYYLRGPDAYGEIQFNKVGDGKLSFIADESRDDYTAATLVSEEDRPAQLVGNMFEYENVNKCGYTFIARFYKKFVVVYTQQKPSSEPYCPYIHATFIKRETGSNN